MAFALINKAGLFLQTMGPTRNDYSFTKVEKEALTFNDEGDAEARRVKLTILNLKVVPVGNTNSIIAAQHLIQIFLVTYLLTLFSS